MRLASWNIAHPCAEDRLREVADVVESLRCDIAALQEVAGSTIERLSELLQVVGLQHTAVHQHDNGWWLLTASRSPMSQLQAVRTIIPLDERDYPRMPPVEVGEVARILSVRLSSPVVIVRNVHVPPGSKVGWRKIDALRALTAELAAWRDDAQIVCGDLNEPREERDGGEIVSWAFENDYARHKPRSWNDAVLGLFRGDIVVDCFRSVHGDAVRSMWSHRRTSASRRYDHVFASPALKPLSADYVDVACADHRPAVVEFAPRAST